MGRRGGRRYGGGRRGRNIWNLFLFVLRGTSCHLLLEMFTPSSLSGLPSKPICSLDFCSTPIVINFVLIIIIIFGIAEKKDIFSDKLFNFLQFCRVISPFGFNSSFSKLHEILTILEC